MRALTRRKKIWLSVATAAAATAAALTLNYSIQQKSGEYRSLAIARRVLAEHGEADTEHTATVLGMARKESRFWTGAIGRDDECGIMQLSGPVARSHGLRTTAPHARSSTLDKLLYSSPTARQRNLDERFVPEKNIRAGTEYWLSLVDNLGRKYGLDDHASMEFGVIAYNLGIGNVKQFLDDGYSKDPDAFLEQLEHSETRIPARKRLVVNTYLLRVRAYRDEYMEKLPSMLERGKPGVWETFIHTLFAVPKEFFERAFYDERILEKDLERTEQKGTSRHAPGDGEAARVKSPHADAYDTQPRAHGM